jgi:hypothetical protein
MADKVEIDETLREVRGQLERSRAQLEVLSKAIWDAIDHEDPASLEAGVRFKQAYNERRQHLEKAATDMLSLLAGWPQSTGPGTKRPEVAPAARETQAQPLPVREPAQPVAAPAIVANAALAGELEKKVPFGFVLSGQTFTSASAWPLFYEALLQELHSRAAEKISRLADAPAGFELAGKPLFARVPDALNDPLPIAEALYAEADLDPPVLIEVIKRLISALGFPLDAFKILLKEKNRGTVETLSLAA